MCRSFLLCFLLFFAPLPALAKKIALVIGNDTYSQIADLTRAREDASGYRDWLRAEGFEFVALPGREGTDDLDRAAMEDALAALQDAIEPGDIVVFVYSGHGWSDGATNFLVPTDTPKALTETQLAGRTIALRNGVTGLLDRIAAKGARLTVAIIDACHDNPFAPPPGRRTTALARGLAREADLPSGSFIAMSARPVAPAPVDPALERLAAAEAAWDRVKESSSIPALERVTADYAGTYVAELARERIATLRKPADPVAPRSLTVDAGGGGDFRSIAEAVKAAKPGARIEVRPGRYTGGVVVDKPLEIVGVGEREDIIWQTGNEELIHWNAPSGRIANLTLIQTGGEAQNFANAVWFDNGSAILENSDLTSVAGAIIGVSGSSAAPTIRSNRIHDGKDAGIVVAENGKGRIEGNEIWANAFPGIGIRSGGDPVVTGNRIHDGKQAGIFVYKNGKGRIEGNEIWANADQGITITSGGDPVVVGNRITGNFMGVRVYDNGRGTITDNDLRGNKRGAFDIEASAGPVVRRNNKE